jgi:hypothetical protein
VLKIKEVVLGLNLTEKASWRQQYRRRMSKWQACYTNSNAISFIACSSGRKLNNDLPLNFSVRAEFVDARTA